MVVMVFICITYSKIKTIGLYKILDSKIFRINHNKNISSDKLELILTSKTDLIKS